MNSPSIHWQTPLLSVSDPRAKTVRRVQFWRDTPGLPAQARVNRSAFDSAGRAVAEWDPRLGMEPSAPANLATIYSLSGKVLSTLSVDAGLRVSLFAEAGQVVQGWDGRGAQRRVEYDALLRTVALYEQARSTERYEYGAAQLAFADHNQCGQLIRHDDPAGTRHFNAFGLTGALLEQAQHFLRDLDSPDWPMPINERNVLLEPGEGATTRSQVNAAGDVVKQTDAKGHRQLFHQTLDGQLREVRLQLRGESTAKTLLSAIVYNAHGQTEREVAGNGVITTLEYDAQNGRLTRLRAQRGNKTPQDLCYAYDPVGNVLSIKDAALPIRYFANQRIEPVSRYFYDSVSQLIEATGWEAGVVSSGPQFSTVDDPAPRANYRQTYHYDRGGNLLELVHEGPQSHGHRMVAAAHSNRCLPVLNGLEPGDDDFRGGFDGNGNLLNLQPGQALGWDLRNQLREVRPVVRDSGLNDRERYVYGADGMRLRKVRETQSHTRTLIAETRYLPNLELRNYSGTGEVLQVISVQAGRSSVRVLHWESEPPNGMSNDQYRYHLNDHLGSCTLELDKDGEVISQERYHPYGTTAWFAGRGEVEASYRTVRYSGKERDATGLYYYGFRYYVAGWQRWLNPDPAGVQDGLNVFAFVSDNPLRYKDVHGETGIDLNALTSEQTHAVRLDGPQSSIADMLFSYDFVSKPKYDVWIVKRETYKGLKLAHVSNLVTKTLLVEGAPNQIVDLWRARREPQEMKDTLSKIRSESRENKVVAAIGAGLGNCGEHASVNFHLLASTKTKGPVFRVSAADQTDHSFVIIGDPRVLSLEEVVIADAWPNFPRAHTADVGLFGIGGIVESASAEADPKYQIDDEELIKNGQIEFPDAGSSRRLESIAGMSKKYMQLFSMQDEFLGSDYKVKGSHRGRFHQLPTEYVYDRVQHLRSYDSARRAM